MKKLSSIILLVALISSANAQENEILFNGDNSSTTTSAFGFGGPMVSATQFDNLFGLTIGGKGGVVFNKKFAFGGLGFGTVNTPEFTGNNLSEDLDAPLKMTYGAGGLFFEYVFNFDDLVCFSLPLNIMAGGAHIYEINGETEIESSAMLIIEPGINIDIRLSQGYTQSFYVSYRKALGSSLVNMDDNAISGLNVGIIFKIGSY